MLTTQRVTGGVSFNESSADRHILQIYQNLILKINTKDKDPDHAPLIGVKIRTQTPDSGRDTSHTSLHANIVSAARIIKTSFLL